MRSLNCHHIWFPSKPTAERRRKYFYIPPFITGLILKLEIFSPPHEHPIDVSAWKGENI